MTTYTKHLSEPWFSLIKIGAKKCEGRVTKGDFSEMKKAIENGSKVILGVNKYPNKSEKISQEKSTLSRLVADFESKIGEGAK